MQIILYRIRYIQVSNNFDPINEIGRRRQPIRQIISESVQAMLANGDIAPGEVVHVSRVASILGVSATPVREALVTLTAKGVLRVEPNRGFVARELAPRELSDLYETICTLEASALESIGTLDDGVVSTLDALNDRLERSEGGEAFSLDMEWHRVLMEECTNTVLAEVLSDLRMRCRKYELVYMSDADRVRKSAVQHRRMLDAVMSGESGAATRILRENWEGNIHSILPQLTDGT